MLIYKITNLINKKIYIGKTELDDLFYRTKVHIREAEKKVNRYLYDAINHYGIENFIITVIDCAFDRIILNEKEKYWIKFYNSTNKNVGYNMQTGGTGGSNNKETLERVGKKIAIANKGKKRTSAQRLKMSKAQKGKIMPIESCEKISNAIKEKWKDDQYRKKTIDANPMRNKTGSLHHFYGKHHNAESKQKMSQSRKGKTYEEIYGENAAKIIKKNKRTKFLGNLNPLFVDVNKNELYNLIIKTNLTIKAIAQHFNCNAATIYSKSKLFFNSTPNQLRNKYNGENENARISRRK